MAFSQMYTNVNAYKKHGRQPDFNNLLMVLQGKEPARPTLCELFGGNFHVFADEEALAAQDHLRNARILVSAFRNFGYDYVSSHASNFRFRTNERAKASTVSLNEGAVIIDRASYEQYRWDNPEDHECTLIEHLSKVLPDGMKIVVRGPGGVLENVISLVGFDNLCFMLADDPELVQEIFNQVGSRVVRYYEMACQYDAVGAIVSNDDWGFKTQTMLSPDHMRTYVFPWHKKIVDVAHAHGLPVILHSCGNLSEVWEDLIAIGFDGKHSYEDNIEPAEEAYERLHGRIAVIGGIDVDFICRSTPEEIYKRAAAMLERTRGRGGYALGSGNSVPAYMPIPNYLAMCAAATWAR